MENPKKYLQKVDPVLAKIISKVELKERKAHKRYFEALTIAIVNQQLSTKAAASILKKFVAIFGGKFPTPQALLKKRDTSLRKAGLSFQKISYIKSLAKLVKQGKVDFNKFGKMDDEAIIEKLILVKGIGRWTAEMFLMSCLGRPDVFSHGDLGLKNAVKKLYNVELKLHPKKYNRIIEKWKPHRTTAARYLWASLSLK